MAIPLIIGAALIAGAGIAKSIQGARQAKQAREIERNNQRPSFDIAKEYFDNQDLATMMAQSGLGEPALNFYRQNAERGLTASLGALAQGGGGPNSVASVMDVYQQNLGSLAATDAQARAQNLRNLMAQNQALAEQRTMRWSLNEYEPYKDRAALAGSLRKIGTENIYGGITQVGSALASYGTSNLYQQPGAGAGTLRQQQRVDNVLPNATVVTDTDVTPPAGMFTPGEGQISFNNPGYSAPLDYSLGALDNSPYRNLVENRLREQYGFTV